MSTNICYHMHCKLPLTSNVSRTLVGNKIAGHSGVSGALPTASSLSTEHLASMDLAKTTAREDEIHLWLGI